MAFTDTYAQASRSVARALRAALSVLSLSSPRLQRQWLLLDSLEPSM